MVLDASLLVPDRYNPGKYRSVCPECKRENIRHIFPQRELVHLFEMIVESAEMNRPIIALVLCRTIFEVMVDGLLYRLMERRYTDTQIIYSVMALMGYQKKLMLVQDITGKSLKELTKKAGHDGLTKTLHELTEKRNAFLHDGIATKPEKVVIQGLFETTRHVELGAEDLLRAVNFAIDTIDFFAKTYSDNGEYIYPFEEDREY